MVNLKQPQGLDEGDLCVEFANFLSNLIKPVRVFFGADCKNIIFAVQYSCCSLFANFVGAGNLFLLRI